MSEIIASQIALQVSQCFQSELAEEIALRQLPRQ
jgi:hypothetical protein